MKRYFTILYLLIISCTGICAQDILNLSDSHEHTISSKKTEYLNIEKGWALEKNLWYYYGNQTMITPVFYTIVETLDSTYIFKGEKTEVFLEIHIESTGSYETTEDGWIWNKEEWTFKEDTVHSYPPSFSKKAKIVRKEMDSLNRNITKIYEVEELYQIENEKWSWDSENKIWLYDKNYTNKTPKYKILKSAVTSYND